MDVQFIASIAVIAPDPSVSRRVLRGCACMMIRQRRYLLLYPLSDSVFHAHLRYPVAPLITG